MLTKKGLFPLVFLVTLVSWVSAPQEEQWTSFLGKPFDSVVVALKAQNTYCDTHTLKIPNLTVIISCVPFEFLGEQGVLILRRAKNGIIRSCSWVRGEYPGFKEVLDQLNEANKAALKVNPGDLDHIFSTVYNYYDQKLINTMSTEDGSYLWRADQLDRKNIEYTMTRSLDYIEFTVTLRDKKSKARIPPMSRR